MSDAYMANRLRDFAAGLRETASKGHNTIVDPSAAITFADCFSLAAEIFEHYAEIRERRNLDTPTR